MSTPSSLRQQINKSLQNQGYSLSAGEFSLVNDAYETLRQAHFLAKRERITEQENFIRNNLEFIQNRMVDGKELSIEKISPKLILVKASSDWEKLFRWWNYVWWSLPYERAFGRQMRYIIWDQYHKAVIGLIGLQSPILSWSPRDKYLNIPTPTKDYWVNQSMSAQRLGALPPYNTILGGKLIAMLMTSDTVRNDFHKKYSNATTILNKRKLPAHLLFVTTTGAFGKSSIYTRLKLREDWLAKFIGYSNGSGSFHIPNEIYEKLLDLLNDNGTNIKRGYGTGPSRKMRLIREGMTSLGYKNGTVHGVRRAIYLFPYAKNLYKLISGDHTKPLWYNHREKDLVEFWKARWILPRIEKRYNVLQKFSRKEFLAQKIEEMYPS